jgi:thiol-disulfide isomerase/thioredoxin
VTSPEQTPNLPAASTPPPETRTGTVRRNRTIAAILGVGFLVVAAVVLVLSFTGDDATEPAADGTPTVGEPAPATPFLLFDDSEATFADYRGRPLVVNFWASWCPSCVAEMSAAFRPVQEQLGDRVAFLGMNNQDERAIALELVDETGVRWDLGDDPQGDMFTELRGIGMPFTVFIAADGSIVERHNGPLSAGQLEAMITELFGV